MKRLLQKKWFLILVTLLLIFAGIQFIRPTIDNPPVIADVTASNAVKKILRTACYDCHSNETRLSWFDKITPANWLVESDVRKGREALNFSEWDRYAKDRQKQILYEILNQVQFNVMPLKQYTFLHPSARITTVQIDSLRSYLTSVLVTQVTDAGKTNVWNDQYYKWIHGITTVREASPNPNGIAFIPGYKNWVAISSTERPDNGSMRIIMGNDIAVTAIKTNHTNPWPDGSTFAKLIWVQFLDSSGNINAGEFKQVDFMTKNRDKYASTDGWGYSRWIKGTQLVPYGDNALFTTGCVNCHQSMKGNDYVFTTPVNITADQDLEYKVINSAINKQQGTMSTLYGNDIAVNFSRTHTSTEYPAGAILSLVTWNQKEDLHWYGAVIPDSIQTIEKIKFEGKKMDGFSPVYEKFEGNRLEKTPANNSGQIIERLHYILNQRASVMP